MMDHEYGCTDGNCILKRPTGMHTNGGCDCLKSLPPRLRRKFAFHLRRLRGERDKALDTLAELADIVDGHVKDGDDLDSFTTQPARAILAERWVRR